MTLLSWTDGRGVAIKSNNRLIRDQKIQAPKASGALCAHLLAVFFCRTQIHLDLTISFGLSFQSMLARGER